MVTFAFSFVANNCDTLVFPNLKMAVDLLVSEFGTEKILTNPNNYRIREFSTSMMFGDIGVENHLVPLERYLEQRTLGLKESKDLVEAMFDNIAYTSDPHTKAFYDIAKNKKIILIKFVRDSSIVWRLQTDITE